MSVTVPKLKVFRVCSKELGCDCYAVAETLPKARYQAFKMYREALPHWGVTFGMFKVHEITMRVDFYSLKYKTPGLYDRWDFMFIW